MSDYKEICKDLGSMAEAYANEVQESAKVWVVVERITEKVGVKEFVDLDMLGIFSSKYKAIEFIRRAMSDDNSGIDSTTLLDIWIENIDGYFSHTEIIDTKLAGAWLTND